MPLRRYEIRNEYSLGDPDLYRDADKDDPEALLEGVAMAGLVGLLRQLGDLAEFAAEIFHDLHEEVMATAARGHGLIVRVQQLEAEFPLIERTLLSQTSHTAFLYNSGVEWHPNLRMDQNTITQGDLPRFVMDSYEECRGPPRLFLLDKFDVAGAGACLKRFTDPSFFKIVSASSAGRKLESQREKKTRKVKKRGPRWRDTPESFQSSHAKLHQLFLEERIESGGNDPDRRVKLKKRQFTGSLFDQDYTRSYMEKFLDTCPVEQKIVHEICIDALPLTWTSNDACESGLEIVEIGTVSPVKGSIETEKGFSSSPDTREIVVKPSLDNINDGKLNVISDPEATEVLALHHEVDDRNVSSTILKEVNGDNFAYRERTSEASVGDTCNSDDVASEIDSYMDALATIESEVETDSESKFHPHSALKPVVVDSDGSSGQQGLHGVFLDSESVGNSSTSEDSNLREKDKSSCSDTTPKIEGVVMAVHTTPASTSDHENMFRVHKSTTEEIDVNETDDNAVASTAGVKVDGIPKAGPESGEASETSCLTKLITKVPSLDLVASPKENLASSSELDQLSSNTAESDIVSGERDQRHANVKPTWSYTPERTNKEHWFNEQPIHGKGWQNSSVYSDTPPDLPYNSDVFAGLLQTEYDKALTVKGQVGDKCMSDINDCSEITQPLEHPSICCPASPGTSSPIFEAPELDCTTLTGQHSKDLSCAPDSRQSFIIQEQLCETESPGHDSPSLDLAGRALLCSQEDPYIEEALVPAGHKKRSSSPPALRQAEMFSAISNRPVPVVSSSEINVAEIVDYGSFEVNDASSVNQPNTDASSGSANGKILKDSLMMGNPSSVLDSSETQDEGQKFPSLAETSSHMPSDELGDENNAFSHNACLSYIPFEHTDDSICLSEAEDNADLGFGVEKVEHIETVADSSREADVTPLSSSLLHPENIQEKLFSFTEKWCQNEESTKGNVIELTEKNHMDSVEDALINSNSKICNLSTDDSPFMVHGLMSEDVKNGGNPFVDAQLISESSSQDVESTSSSQIHLPEANDYVDSPTDEPFSPVFPSEKDLDIQDNESAVKSLQADDFYSKANNYYKQSETPNYVEREGCESTAASCYYGKVSVSEPPLQSAESTLERSRQGMPEYSVVFLGNGMLNGANQVDEEEKSKQPAHQPHLPVLETLPSEPQMTLEAPPLPPLPPMQWRLGRFQNSSAAPARQMVQHTVGQFHVQPMSLPAVHLGPVGSMSLPAVHHTVPGQSVAIPTVHYTIAPAEPVTLPALHHTLVSAPPMTLPTIVNENETITPTSKSEGQPSYSNGYAAHQGGFMRPYMPTVSEDSSHNYTYAVGVQDNLLPSVPSTSGYLAVQGGFTLPMLATVSQNRTTTVGRQDNLLCSVTSTSTGPHSGANISEELYQFLSPSGSPSLIEGHASEHNHAMMGIKENAHIGAPNELLECAPQVAEQEAVNSFVQFLPPSTAHQPSVGFVASEAGRTWLSTYDGTPIHASGNTNGVPQKKPPRPRNPLIDEVVAIDKSKLRKVERNKFDSKLEEGESLLEQMQLRKVERIQAPVESKVAEGGSLLEQLQLRKVGERVKLPVQSKTEDSEFLPEKLHLRKVSERIKPEVELKFEETESPRVQLRKVSERVKQEVELKIEETESPRMQLRKVGEKTQPVVGSKTEERDSLFEQIRNKSFSLKPAIAARPNIQGPRTNLKVAAILEKASNIRQAMAGSDEDDDADCWSDC